MSLIATLLNKVPRETKAGVGKGLKGWSDRQTERETWIEKERERDEGLGSERESWEAGY